MRSSLGIWPSSHLTLVLLSITTTIGSLQAQVYSVKELPRPLGGTGHAGKAVNDRGEVFLQWGSGPAWFLKPNGETKPVELPETAQSIEIRDFLNSGRMVIRPAGRRRRSDSSLIRSAVAAWRCRFRANPRFKGIKQPSFVNRRPR